MQAFKSPTPKPTTLVSSFPALAKLENENPHFKRIPVSEENRTCAKYQDSNGLTRYKGTASLKGSQRLDRKD